MVTVRNATSNLWLECYGDSEECYIKPVTRMLWWQWGMVHQTSDKNVMVTVRDATSNLWLECYGDSEECYIKPVIRMLWWQWLMVHQTSDKNVMVTVRDAISKCPNGIIGFFSLFNKSTTVIFSSIPFQCFIFLFLVFIDTVFVSLLYYIVSWNVVISNLFPTYFKCVVCIFPNL